MGLLTLTSPSKNNAVGSFNWEGGVIVTDPVTGGQKLKKDIRFDLIPVIPMAEVSQLYGYGANKYEDNNWRKGYAWSLSYAALQRHAQRFWSGETIDPETGLPHMTAVVFHALALLEFDHTHPELDDRYKA